MAFKEYAKDAETRVVLMVSEVEQAALHALALLHADGGHLDISNIDAEIGAAIAAHFAEIEDSLTHFKTSISTEIAAVRAEIAKAAAVPPVFGTAAAPPAATP